MQSLLKVKYFAPFVKYKSLIHQQNTVINAVKKMNVIFDKLNVFKSCGIVHGIPVAPEYIDFYEDMYEN